MRTRRSLRCIVSVLLFAGAASTALAQNLVELETPDCKHLGDVETAIAVDPLSPCDAVAMWFSPGTDADPGPGCTDTVKEGWYATTRDGWDTFHLG